MNSSPHSGPCLIWLPIHWDVDVVAVRSRQQRSLAYSLGAKTTSSLPLSPANLDNSTQNEFRF